MPPPLTTVQIRYEHDVVTARQRARQIASIMGFDAHDQVRIATAVSELARNAFRYAKGGKVEFGILPGAAPALQVRITDQGPGISRLGDILDGRYVSETGMGMGILGARRLMDSFDIQTEEGRGTIVTIAKNVPIRSGAGSQVSPSEIAEKLARLPAQDPFEELQRQNQELIAALDELQRQKRELAELNRELEDTNRGVVALYAELDERADYLRRASELKTQFLSNMTHEFRTPLNSILSLSRILLDRIDGPLSEEQQRQVEFIQRAANDLSDLVNDLLDLAKVEAGKVQVRPAEFGLEELFGALRGMLRPLLAHNSAISLVFDSPGHLVLKTDESKVSQVLRNLISNALKFTERGEVRVSAALEEQGMINLAVADTGIGIALEDQERIFQEFTQVEGPHQKGKRGTGLGLPLSRKLAELLGGTLTVESQPGVGSVFRLRIPVEYSGPGVVSMVPEISNEIDPGRIPVLIVEDNRETVFVYEKYLKGTPFQPLAASTVQQARSILEHVRPAAIILDVLLAHESTWSLLGDLKSAAATRDIPAIVVTMVENQHKATALGADAFHIKPVTRQWLLGQLSALTAHGIPRQALVIDDDAASRYILAGLLAQIPLRVIEAAGAREGLELARERRPDIIFLDLKMPDLNGFGFLAEIQNDSAIADIPIIVNTSKPLTAAERKKLNPHVLAIIKKDQQDPEASLNLIRNALGMAGASSPVNAAVDI